MTYPSNTSRTPLFAFAFGICSLGLASIASAQPERGLAGGPPVGARAANDQQSIEIFHQRLTGNERQVTDVRFDYDEDKGTAWAVVEILEKERRRGRGRARTRHKERRVDVQGLRFDDADGELVYRTPRGQRIVLGELEGVLGMFQSLELDESKASIEIDNFETGNNRSARQGSRRGRGGERWASVRLNLLDGRAPVAVTDPRARLPRIGMGHEIPRAYSRGRIDSRRDVGRRDPSLGLTNVIESDRRGQTYRVRRGDTLRGVARDFGVSVDALVRVNGIYNRDRIHVGQVLEIPSSTRRFDDRRFDRRRDDRRFDRRFDDRRFDDRRFDRRFDRRRDGRRFDDRRFDDRRFADRRRDGRRFVDRRSVFDRSLHERSVSRRRSDGLRRSDRRYASDRSRSYDRGRAQDGVVIFDGELERKHGKIREVYFDYNTDRGTAWAVLKFERDRLHTDRHNRFDHKRVNVPGLAYDARSEKLVYRGVVIGEKEAFLGLIGHIELHEERANVEIDYYERESRNAWGSDDRYARVTLHVNR